MYNYTDLMPKTNYSITNTFIMGIARIYLLIGIREVVIFSPSFF